jgi:hypothetical protein
MSVNPYLKPLLSRFLIALSISVIFVLVMSEVAFRLQKSTLSRAPQVIELVIPAGTAVKVAAGQLIPSIPEEMIFVVGDQLVVINDDIVDHQLGPLWIPAGTSATLPLTEKSEYAYSCSFQATQYLGLTVREALTWRSRLTALWYAAPPTIMFLMVYSFVLFPIKIDREPIPVGKI